MDQPSIIVAFALPQESRDFRDELRREPRDEVRVEHFGVGPEMAAERIRRLLEAARPRLLICAGFAGGLDPHVALADLVIAENLSSPEALATARAVAVGTPLRCTFGSILSRAIPVESVPRKAALHRDTGAVAVDMESEAIAEVCRAKAVPLLVVRTISDPADAPLPVPFSDWFDIAQQRPRVFGLLKYLAFHPSRIGPFASFVGSLAPARRALAKFLTEFLDASQQNSG